MVEPQIRGFAASDDEISDAQWVLREYRKLAHTGETWVQIDVSAVDRETSPRPMAADSYLGRHRVIDRYEAARAQELLEWQTLCQERDREKAEAVERVRAAESGESES